MNPALRSDAWLVLVVDDVPDNLGLLHDALDEAGCTVLLALDGETALQRASQAQPDVILLDAVMPGLDGFEVARRLQAQARTAHIPIVFMTGLTDPEHLEAALEAGAVDYVTKPVKPREVLARMRLHLRGARAQRQTRAALDAFGYASLTVRLDDGRLLWQTPLARELLQRYFPQDLQAGRLPADVRVWLERGAHTLLQAAREGQPLAEPPRMSVVRVPARLVLRLHRQLEDQGSGSASAHAGAGEWLVIMQEESDERTIETLSQGFGLTTREAQVLYWVVQGKINRDIGDILGTSPMTVKKHLERVFAKLGVETRTAAAAMALQRIGQSQPAFQAVQDV